RATAPGDLRPPVRADRRRGGSARCSPPDFRGWAAPWRHRSIRLWIGRGVRPDLMRTCVPMIVSVLLPRFELTIAAGDRTGLLGVAAALAPLPGAAQQVGEPSTAAEAFGVHAGMRLGEALSRCPRLVLVPADPAGVADAWERLLVRLESVGAAVESDRPGLACF